MVFRCPKCGWTEDDPFWKINQVFLVVGGLVCISTSLAAAVYALAGVAWLVRNYWRHLLIILGVLLLALALVGAIGYCAGWLRPQPRNDATDSPEDPFIP